MGQRGQAKTAGTVNGKAGTQATRPAKAGVVIVSSGSDWYGRYGRRPQPRLKGEEGRGERQCARDPA